MKLNTFYLLGLLLIFSLTGIDAQQYWTLEKCVMHSLENNIDVNQSLLGIKTAEINNSQSIQQRYPSFNGSTSASLSFGRSIDPTSNQFVTASFFSNSYGLNTGVTLFNGGVINNSIKQSNLDIQAAIEDAEQIKVNTALAVANAYLAVLFAKENIDLAYKQLEISKQQYDQMDKFIRAGARPESELLNLEAQIKQSEQGIIEADNELEIRMLNLKQLLRLPPDEDMEIIVPENIVVSTDPEMIGFGEAFAEAQKNRPDLRAGDLRVKSAELDVKIAKGNFYPNLGLGGSLNTNYAKPSGFNVDSYTTQLDANISYGFGASVNIPLYNNGNVKSNVQRAKIGVENAMFQYEQLIEVLKTNVQQALANARASKKKLEASEKALEAQILAFENTTKRLDIGAANSFEWESQKTQMENAEISRLIDKYNYLFNIKILEFYLGKPLKL